MLYVCRMKFESGNLKTIKNFALSNGVTASYIYKMIKEGRMKSVSIDGIQFIDLQKFSKIPTR